MFERLSKRLGGHIFPLFVLGSEGLLTLVYKVGFSITSVYKGGKSWSAVGLQRDCEDCPEVCGRPILLIWTPCEPPGTEE